MKNLMFSMCSTFFVFAVVMLCTNVRAMAQPPEPLIINFVEDVDLFSFQSSNENTHLRLEYVQVPDTNQYELHISSTTESWAIGLNCTSVALLPQGHYLDTVAGLDLVAVTQGLASACNVAGRG